MRLSPKQNLTLLKLHYSDNTFFSKLPIEIIQEISGFATNDIGQALQHAAYAREEDVEGLRKMLDENPGLLLQREDVKTPGGDVIKNVTIYELVLGAGDYELAKIVQSYFSKIKDGKKHQIHQYESYRPHIDDMLKQKPYDLEPLIDLIKKASAEDVTALLNKDMTRKSELCAAMVKFRKDWAPRILTKPCMHYNYMSLQHAFVRFDRDWDDLYKADGNGYDRILLVWRQLIGFEMRRLPGIDRCAMARGLYSVTEGRKYDVAPAKGRKWDVPRSYNYGRRGEDFPVIAVDDSLDGLGWDFAFVLSGSPGGVWSPQHRQYEKCWGQLISNKNSKLAELMQSQPVHQPTCCLIL